MGRLAVTVIARASEFAGLRDEWNGLVRECGQSPFSSHEWLSTYWAHYGEGSRLCVAVARTEEGRLVGAWPLQVREVGAAGLRFISRAVLLGAPLTDMQDLLLMPGYGEDAIAHLAEVMTSRRIDYLDLPELPEHSPLRAWANHPSRFNLLAERPSSRLPFVSLPDSWTAFLASRGTSTQRNVKYYGNRLSKKHRLEFAALTGPEEIEQALPAFFDLYEKRFAEYPLLTTPAYRGFRREMALLFAKNGWITLFVLKLNGLAVATELCLRWNRTLYAYNSCYDPDWSREGTTLIMQARILEHAIAQGFSEYNFLRGEEAYKAHWATGTRQQYALHFYRPGWRVQVAERSRGVRHFLAGAVATGRGSAP